MRSSPDNSTSPFPYFMGPEIEQDVNDDALRLLSRSPHPYRRRRTNDTPSTHGFPSPSTLTPAHSDSERGSAISPNNGKTYAQRTASKTPSESGTEADDEGYGFVKALPAPPPKLRKGLRDARGNGLDGGITPLLTPSLIEEEGERSSQSYFRQRRAEREAAQRATDDEARAAKEEKVKRRRRAELIRRAAETALLGAVGATVLGNVPVWNSVMFWYRGMD